MSKHTNKRRVSRKTRLRKGAQMLIQKLAANRVQRGRWYDVQEQAEQALAELEDQRDALIEKLGYVPFAL